MSSYLSPQFEYMITVGEFFLRGTGFGSTIVRLDENVARVFSVSQA